MGVRLLALLEEQLRLNLQLLEMARETPLPSPSLQAGVGAYRDTPRQESVERLVSYQGQREGLLDQIGSIQEAVDHRCEAIEIASLPLAVRQGVETVCNQIAATVREILELDHPFQQKLIAWQEGILEEIKELQEGKKALAAYKPSGEIPPRFFDRKV